jgi:hypothetical protein
MTGLVRFHRHPGIARSGVGRLRTPDDLPVEPEANQIVLRLWPADDVPEEANLIAVRQNQPVDNRNPLVLSMRIRHRVGRSLAAEAASSRFAGVR